MAYNIADLFEHTVDSVADREVLVIGDERRSYGQLEARANRLAHHLAAQGIGAGDHIGVYGSNSIGWIEATLAAYKVRAVPVNVNFRYVADELRYLFDNADLKAVVYDRELAPRLAAVRDDLPLLRHLIHIDDGSTVDVAAVLEELGSVPFESAMALGAPERDFPARSADDHYVLYTGGTTGMPKGVVWRHEDVFYSLGGGIDAYTNERVEDEWSLANKAKLVETPLRSLNLPPLMHGAAQWGFLRFAFEGNLIVMLRRFDPHEVWRTIEREQINSIAITGDAMARPMIEALDDLGGPGALDLSCMFVLASTAAIFSPTVKDRYLDAFPNLLLIDAIGSSETGSNGMRTVAKGDTQNKGGGPTVAAGRDTVVLDEDLKEIPPGTGRQGRLARRGNVPLAYYKDEKKSAETFVIGANGMRYALAGDMAILEADGTITLLGRGSQCINSGGEKIFPEEVESALKAHPSVFDAIVVGVPDDRWGQRVAAVVQPREGLSITLDELDAHCRGHVAAYKVPKEVHLVAEVVRSPSGKPDYPWAGKVARGEISLIDIQVNQPLTQENTMQIHDKLYIGGEWVAPAGPDVIDVISPHSEELVGRVPEGTTADIDRAVAAARTAFDEGEWPRMSAEERIEAVQRFSDIYAARMMDMAQLITTEMGSPISFSQLAQSPAPWMMLNSFIEEAKKYPWEEERTGMLGTPVIVRSEGVGVVGAIVPWNVPQFVTMSKLAPALLSGSTIVIKPSPETPLDAMLMAELLEEAGIPKGVVSVIPAGREVGEHLVRHRGVDKIAFTGSTAAGRTIASICGEQLKRVSLELGGKSAAIILDDADLAATVEGLKFASLMNNGQACVAQTRILASRKNYAAVVDALGEAVKGMTVGDPDDPTTEIGPLVAERQQERVEKYIALGQEEGARLVVGGNGRPAGFEKGWYVQPTVFADVDNSMRIAQEEIFGPVLAVIPYDDVDDAVRIANDSEFGLAGSVWTGDPSGSGMDVARRVRTGTFGVNQYTMDFVAPFGGFKASGIGREFGKEGLEHYLEQKTICP